MPLADARAVKESGDTPGWLNGNNTLKRPQACPAGFFWFSGNGRPETGDGRHKPVANPDLRAHRPIRCRASYSRGTCHILVDEPTQPIEIKIQAPG